MNNENKTNDAIKLSKENTPMPIQNTTAPVISQDSKNMALINWLGCLFFGFIPPLVLFLTQKDDAYVQQQSKEALNWSITFFIGYLCLWIAVMVLGFILGMVFAPLAVIPMIIFILSGFLHPIFCIMGAVKCSSGQDFKVPFNIRLIK
ncbi:DUF4870 domain-containing protein [Psychrobacter sp. I-STPA10]|uniref:DUF4870 domain-containing protein n=1 Tax=Psychrobacter sp. I-STPA10 TaxID=2585769 RepID=UPI001E4E4D2F|nr:DUF4870 domain-containing protein [Psychrobacter sp. I-STPA10]